MPALDETKILLDAKNRSEDALRLASAAKETADKAFLRADDAYKKADSAENKTIENEQRLRSAQHRIDALEGAVNEIKKDTQQILIGIEANRRLTKGLAWAVSIVGGVISIVTAIINLL